MDRYREIYNDLSVRGIECFDEIMVDAGVDVYGSDGMQTSLAALVICLQEQINDLRKQLEK